jgi:sRNA-binding protein
MTRRLFAERFPDCFLPKGGEKRPLKRRIIRDLQRSLPELSVKRVEDAVRAYTGNRSYLMQLTEGAVRVDLLGKPAGVVTAGQSEHARNRLVHLARLAGRSVDRSSDHS